MGTARKVGRGIGGTIKWIAIGGVALIVILVVIMIVSLGQAADESDKSSAQVGPQKYAQIKVGQTKAQVRNIIGGKPESVDETDIGGLSMECWYYGVLSSDSTYQFCFEGNRLSTKSRI